MKRTIKNFISIMLLFILVIAESVITAQAATATNQVPITTYTLNGTVTTYTGVNGSYSGYIATNDQCTILEVYDSGWVKVKYPVSWGYKTAYAKSENFFANVNFNSSTITLGKNLTVYQRSDLSTKLGTVYSNDSVVVVASNEKSTQIIYPISGGYKMGWVQGVYYNTNDVETRISDGYYQIKSGLNTDYVLDIYGAYTENGVNVQLYQNCWTTNQGFLIVEQQDGYYTIEALHSNKVLDVDHDGKIRGSNVIQQEKHGGDNQLWKIYRTSDGYYRFQGKSSGLFLDVYGALAANETNIQIWEYNGSGAQKFVLEEVTVNGERYQKAETSEREQVVNYLNACATIEWTPQISFYHWSGSRRWYSGTTYYGIPYTQRNRTTTLEIFKENLEGKIYIGPTSRMTYMGSDCSSAVAMAYATVDKDFPITATYYMFPNYEYMAMVGVYNTGNEVNSANICNLNGRDAMYAAYRCLQPGDLLLETEHVMMVTEVGDEYVKVTHQTTFDSSLSSTWRVNQKWTYSELFNNNYIPVTLKKWDTVQTEQNAQTAEATGFDPIWPCENTYTVTTLYKYSSGGAHSCRFKYGIDIGAPSGENVLAVESGVVICSEYSRTSGFGNWIMVQHSNGKVSLYAHLSSRKVSVGDTVEKGQVIGLVGNTSAKYSLAPHLHFELGDSNTSGATGDAYQEYYKTKYGNKIVLTQAAKKYSEP